MDHTSTHPLLNHARRSLWLGWLLDNPLLVREIRRRMRGKLFSWSLILYVLALGGASCMIMFILYPAPGADLPLREAIQKVQGIGTMLYNSMRLLEMFIALIIAPLLTAGLATVEKEKDTFDFLRVTTLHERTFIAGCLLTTACFLVLVFCCTLPVMGLTFIFGGVSMQDILSFNLLLFLSAMAICAIGIFISTNYQRSVSMLASMVVLLMVFGFVIMQTVGGIFGPMAGGASIFSGSIWWRGVLLGTPLFMTIVFGTAASRRLYDANNRLFNYKQFLAMLVIAAAAMVGAAHFYSTQTTLISNMASWYFYLVWFVLAASVVVFSAGRIERGDEVWRLRSSVSVFQRFPEDVPFYGLLIALWLGPVVYFSTMGWMTSATISSNLSTMTPIFLAGLFFLFGSARLSSGLFETRNQSMLGVIVAAIVCWVIIPAIGALVSGIFSPNGGGFFELIGQMSVAFSPIWTGYALWDDSSLMPMAFVPVVTNVALGAAALAFSLLPKFKKRTRVSYRYITATDHGSTPETAAT